MGRDLLLPHLGRLIGSGDSTPLWRSPWLSLTHSLAPMGSPTAETHDLTVTDLRDPSTLNWNWSLIRRVLPMYEKDILKLRPSTKGAPDAWAWLPTKSGEYSAKSGYFEALREDPEVSPDFSTLDPTAFNWKANIWTTKTSPKTKMLLWKASQNALHVGENLKYRRINDSVVCPHCGAEETTTHLFFHCPFAKTMWEKAPFKHHLNLTRIETIQEGISLANKLTCLPPTGIGEGSLFPWIFWAIWTSRNQIIFSNKQIQAEESLLLAIVRAKEWQEAQRSLPQPRSISIPAPTRQPDPILTTCFTDASWRLDGKTGLGWVFLNPQGTVVLRGSAIMSQIPSPLMAEALATLSAVRIAIESDLSTISFASDSLILVKALNSELPHKELHGIHHDILHLSSSFNYVAFNFVSRDKNRMADSLAKEALRLACMNTQV